MRRLLGTATQLFLDDRDSISVHCLAASALEHSEYLAESNGGQSLKMHMMSTFPEMKEQDIRRLRNHHYRVIKHSKNLRCVPFDVREQLADFDDSKNDAVLFAGWLDFMKCGHPTPVAAQVFQLWFFRVYPHSLNPEIDFDFPGFEQLERLNRFDQKSLLREEIEKALKQDDIVEHKMTDTRPLILA